MAALAPLGVEDDGLGLDFFLPDNLKLPPGLVPFFGHYEFEAVGIGGQHFTKRLPEHKLVELLRTIDRPVVLLGGPEDAEAGARVAGTLGWEGRWNIVNACGQLSLLQTGLVIAGASHVYSHDTGTMHMAAAFQRPLTAIWGSTVPEFGMYPFRAPHADWQVALPCRPCHKHGREACPLGHFKCMEEQRFEVSG
jgi:ADP-heptose:LPS heptosyltransferase